MTKTPTTATKTLGEQLRKLQQEFAGQIPEAMRSVMKEKVEELARSGIVERSLGVGAKAPDFMLPNAFGFSMQLSAFLRNGPVVLSFYRGGWCPYCNLDLRALAEALPEIGRRGATLLAISPETPDHALSTAEKHELPFPVLSDQGNRVARAFGLAYTLPPPLRTIYEDFGINLLKHNGDERYELPLPATYVIDREGTIRFSFVSADYTQRAEPADVIAALEELGTGLR